MKLKFPLRRPEYGLMLVLLWILIWGCGSGGSSEKPSAADTGAVCFEVAYHEPGDGPQPRSITLDCAATGVVTIEAAVYRPSGFRLVDGGPWDCGAGRGIISSVPAGGDLSLVLLGKNADGDIILRGEKSGIAVVEGNETDAGTIDCYAFVPSVQAPADGSVVHPDAMGFAWGTVTTASEYRVIVSQHSDLSHPFIDLTTPATYYAPAGLSDTGSCYWQVIACDAFGNASIASPILSFTVDANHANTPPTAQITRPADGSTYAVNDPVRFAGLGSDNEDGDLSGATLKWHSDRDGQMGNQLVFDTDRLSIGAHEITLTAIDSEGAIDTDSIEVNIVTRRPIKILFAIDCSGSMGAAGVGTDPDNRRLGQVLAFVEQYNILPDVSFEIMLWNSSIIDSTMVDGYRGFTKDLNEIKRVLSDVQNLGTTDYVGTLEGIYQDIRRDRLDPDNRDSIDDTKYTVVFLSDGLDNMPGYAGPRVEQILYRIDELAAMVTGEANASDLAFHTFLLTGIDMTPEDQQACINLLQDMADYGQGQFHEFDSADVIEFIKSVEIRG